MILHLTCSVRAPGTSESIIVSIHSSFNSSDRNFSIEHLLECDSSILVQNSMNLCNCFGAVNNQIYDA